MRKTQYRFTAVVRAPAPRVIALLSDRLREQWGGVARVEPIEDGVVVEGGWWYRGEYHVEPSGAEESLVVHEVVNVAPRGTRWMVPLFVRSRSGQHRASFLELLSTVDRVLPEERPMA